MSFKILHFRGAEKILQEKKMNREIKQVMQYLDDCLFGTLHKGEILRQALQENDWRQNGDLNVLDGRRYFYKGFRNKVAIDGSFSSYEYIQNALLKLQVGFDHKKIDMGIVLVTAQRSEKSRLGTTKDLVNQEIDMLYPTISLPVTVVLFDLGRPGEIYEENKQKKEAQEETDDKVPQKLNHVSKKLKPNHVHIDPKLADEYLHGNSAAGKKKSRLKPKKAALQDQQEAA